MKIKIKKLHQDAIIPQYQTNGAAGFDFHAVEDSVVLDHMTRLIPTGLSFEIPEGYELQVRPRSGLSLKTNLRIANAPGTVDADFRGEVQIIMENKGGTPHKIAKGERIAQGIICPVVKAVFELTEELTDTERGSGGFGSTGGKEHG